MGDFSKAMAILTPKLVRTGLTYILSFGLGKGAAFCAALALPRLVDADTYGAIELALTVGILGATILGLGAPSVAVKYDLMDKDPRSVAILLGQSVWLAVLGVVGATAAVLIGLSASYVCGAVMIGLFGAQSASTSFFRMRGYIHVSGWVENASIMIVFVCVAGLAAVGAPRLGPLTGLMLAVTLGTAAIAAIGLARHGIAGLKVLAGEVVRIGSPMMVFGLGQLMLFSTARLAIAHEGALTDVASYSLCARIALVMVFASQILNVGLFRTVYRASGEMIARYFAIWIAVLSLLAFAVSLAGYFGATLAVLGTQIAPSSFAFVFPIVAMQTTIWVLNSNLEQFVVRDLLSRPAAVASFVIVGAGALVMLGLSAAGRLDLMAILGVYSVGMLAMLLAQMRLLAHKGVAFRGAYFVLPLAALPLLIYLLPYVA